VTYARVAGLAVRGAAPSSRRELPSTGRQTAHHGERRSAARWRFRTRLRGGC